MEKSHNSFETPSQDPQNQRKISSELSSALEKFNAKFLRQSLQKKAEDILDEISPNPNITSVESVSQRKPLRPTVRTLHVPEVPPQSYVVEVDQPELIRDENGEWVRKAVE